MSAPKNLVFIPDPRWPWNKRFSGPCDIVLNDLGSLTAQWLEAPNVSRVGIRECTRYWFGQVRGRRRNRDGMTWA